MRNASVHLSIVGTLSLVILGLDSSWPLSVICRIPPEHKSWSSTFPFNRRAIFIYWWAQIFWHSCRGTCADMSSPPKRRVSSPLVKLNDSWVLLGILRTFGLVSDVWDRPDVCSEMSESLIICSKSTKFARGWLLVSGFAGCVGCFALPSEFEVCESGSPWFSLPNCASALSTTLPSISSARHNQDKPPMSSKNLKLCGLFFDNFVGLSRILFGTEKVVAHISCADGYCAVA